MPLRRAEAAGRADFATRVEADRHRDLDGVGRRVGEILAEHHQHLVERAEAELLVALAPLLRLGADQPGLLEHLQVGRDGRLRQVERGGDVVDVEPRLAMQEPQHARPHGEARPRRTSGRSSGSIIRKLRDIAEICPEERFSPGFC